MNPNLNDNEQSWEYLAEQSQAGHKQSYTKLLRQITPYIQAKLAPTLANYEWVNDVTQNVLISVHKSLKTYAPDRPFKPWLNTIINFRRADFLRRHYRQKHDQKTTLDNPEFLNKHVTNASHAGELKDAEAALNALSDKQRKVYLKLRVEGQSVKDVAQEMDMTESAVKVSVHRSAKKIRKFLDVKS